MLEEESIPKWMEKLKNDPLYIAQAGRKTYKIDFVDNGRLNDGEEYDCGREEMSVEKGANCWSSESKLVPGMHLPCFDVDHSPESPAPQMGLLTIEDIVERYCRILVQDPSIPIRWVPSSTPGNHHIYIDYAVPWDSYLTALGILAAAKIVEPGYYDAAKNVGATFVRFPGVKRATPRPEPRSELRRSFYSNFGSPVAPQHKPIPYGPRAFLGGASA